MLPCSPLCLSLRCAIATERLLCRLTHFGHPVRKSPTNPRTGTAEEQEQAAKGRGGRVVPGLALVPGSFFGERMCNQKQATAIAPRLLTSLVQGHFKNAVTKLF